jgi:hypothetical protein
VHFMSMAGHRLIILGGSILLAASIAVGLWPVTVGAGIIQANSGGVRTSISCGSPLFKSHPVYSAPFGAIRTPRFDDCSRTRDHRRLPVKILGSSGLVCVVVGVGVYGARRRKQNPA